MASSALHLAYTFDEYVRFERDAANKHEFVAGAILAMAGGTIEHGALCAAVLGMLREQLRGRRCRAYDSNTRIRVAASGNAYYPDAAVVCGELRADPADQLSILNPAVLVEVLSPSTAEYDATEKLADYMKIEGLMHVVHVHHDARRVDVFSLEDQRSSVTSFGPGEVAQLPLVGAALPVDELYFDPLAQNG
jgi:Uma2 family endonuclease